MEVEKSIDLISSDNQKITINEKACKKSKMIKNVLDDYPESTEIPCPKVKGSILAKIKEYLEHYMDVEEIKPIEKPLKSKEFKGCVNDEFDFTFMEVSIDDLFDIIEASNFLDIPPLQELASAKVASIIKGTTSDEIRQEFNLQAEFTQEEERAILEENKYNMENI